ncbi:hypothetical protein M8494_36215 [Serratia ureilytica]
MLSPLSQAAQQTAIENSQSAPEPASAEPANKTAEQGKQWGHQWKSTSDTNS